MRVRKITKTWMLLVGTVVLCLAGCGKETQTADFSGVTSVCELATLKCYYHNVAKAETEASGIFAKPDIRKSGRNIVGLLNMASISVRSQYRNRTKTVW